MPIELTHKGLFDAFLSDCPARLSDYSFANTFIWRDSIHLRWRVIRDHLCVFANGDGGLTLLFPPLGRGDFRAAVREAMEVCGDYNTHVRFPGPARIEYVSREVLAAFGGDFTAEPMSGDYVYRTRRMIDLDGGDLSSKRQARNRFARRYAARTEPFGPQHVQRCLELLGLWHAQHDEAPQAGSPSVLIKRAKEEVATAEAIRNAAGLGLSGMVLFADEQLVGFTFGEMIGPDTCSILIEKTDRAFAGSAQYIFSEFCRQFWAHATWCNVGDDWEVPSLAWTKESYRPAARLPKWTVRPVRAIVLASIPAAEPAVAGAAEPAVGVREPELAVR